MNNLITIKNENGKQLVSARELYKGLGLARTKWTPWHQTNIIENDFFKANKDWIEVSPEVTGNETVDFAISIEFAKHIAMMAKTKKSHEYRNYFIECEELAKSVQPQLSQELQAIFVIDQRTTETNKRITTLENTMPLFTVECKELQALVRKIGTKSLGGYRTPAYNDNSLRAKVYKDIHQQLKREFNIERYEGIKRSQLDVAKEIVSNYKIPLYLHDEIILANEQCNFLQAK